MFTVLKIIFLLSSIHYAFALNDLGDSISDGDRRKMTDLLECADLGDAEALRHLARIYRDGECGVEKSPEKFIEYLGLAAERDDKVAQCVLGMFFRDGEYVMQNHDEAFRYFKLAADQGEFLAMHYVSSFYRDGLSVPKDLVQANSYAQRSLSGFGLDKIEDVGIRCFVGLADIQIRTYYMIKTLEDTANKLISKN